MRICDKCGETVMYTQFHDVRNLDDYDLCKPCYDIIRAWLYDGNRKFKDDPIEPTKEVKDARRNKR